MGRCARESRTFTIVNRLGLHARPASMFVRTASRFAADIEVHKDTQLIDGKSLLGLLTLAAGQGSTLTVCANGEDAVEALDALQELFDDKFGED